MSPENDSPKTPSPDGETEDVGSSALLHGSSIDTPAQIGPYKILEKLGEGGMGVVYLAEQKEPIRRRVALKVIKAGMDTKEVVARFEAEKQALAMMDHPGIARVYDAGATEDGRPYFAMEHVSGLPLTEFCNRRKLSITERLKLILQVCQGIEHAHRRGVTHRDIKPTNILVGMPDKEPVAKIIDFGVARATNQRLTEKTLYTEIGRAVGTFAYMSPEQADFTGEGLDHRTDIYSLGAVLYELLVGQLPLEIDVREMALNEIVRRIQEEEPARPSVSLSRFNPERMTSLAKRRDTNPGRLIHDLRGDLDWICMKALDKERSRRYETAAHFADDLERHLKSDPVLARPPSALYRLRKFTRKNRGPVAALTAVVLSLAVGLVIALVFYAFAEKQRAENLALADYGRLRTYTEEAENLWPYPFEKRGEVERWVDKAERLLGRLDDYGAELARLRKKALTEDSGTRPSADGETQEGTFRFATPETERRHEMLKLLVEGLEAFGDSDAAKGTVTRARHRLAIFPSRELFERRWKEAIAAIARSATYAGVPIKRIADFFPIGEDPKSGLWEFVHLRTGGEPERGQDGRLILTEDTGLVLVLLPGGKFLMGAQRGDKNAPNYDSLAYDRESPAHEVALSPFFIAKYEVRQTAWERVMGENPSRFKGNSLPVETVSWDDCKDFCDKLGLSLPTAAQWEYACRAGTSTPYGGMGQLEEMAWYVENSGRKTHPVGQKQPNAFGLHDIHGNAWEWCEDVYDETFYSKPESSRRDPVAKAGSEDRVRRGGSWSNVARICRSAIRYQLHPSERFNALGVRPSAPSP
ncbi:MAG: bifunctional serine/threonine-protein kinase/formylglycine-generating enzyme family protein [Planctomycetota bacterium]|nr:bifunctional serine/threonine-protein kinase/formylglycine-generating enzyme family protein [Planctomycetota bacterium]